ncbi:MAG: hypothetical protein K6D59_01945 [Bacteroidales bacterium]|nr:hypothetical protein [Bacteroidales bacterium]
MQAFDLHLFIMLVSFPPPFSNRRGGRPDRSFRKGSFAHFIFFILTVFAAFGTPLRYRKEPPALYFTSSYVKRIVD